MTTAPEYVLVGNITADIAPDSRLLGGTVSYSALTAAAFGLHVGLLTSAAAGEPLLDQLRQVLSLEVVAAEQTTTFENIYMPAGRVQYLRASAARPGVESIPAAWRSAPMLHIAPIAGELDETVGELARAFPQATTLLTLQGCLRRTDDDQRVHFKQWFDLDALQHIDVVVFSEEDIIEAPDMEREFANNVRCLVVTRAEKGGTLYMNGVPHAYPTPQVELVHPTGAGDIFAAALLASLHLFNGNHALAVRAAASLAARSVTRVGLTSTPTPAEVSEVLASVGAAAE